MQHVAPPALPNPRNVRQLGDEPRGDQQPPGADPEAVLERHGEAALDRLGRDDAPIEHLRSVATDLLPPCLEQRGRGHAVPGEVPVDPGSGRVAWLARVDNQHRAPGSTKDQRAAEAGGATTDHHDVVGCETLGVCHLHLDLLLPEFSVPYHSMRFPREMEPGWPSVSWPIRPPAGLPRCRYGPTESARNATSHAGSCKIPPARAWRSDQPAVQASSPARGRPSTAPRTLRRPPCSTWAARRR